ncbi:MAG TPA: baseplate J/gp47 family protein, partial [Thermoanaerobaculia bacterium]|nr:baseplate J/gp47 family protein [Thermoanaerobaculia bacterium]
MSLVDRIYPDIVRDMLTSLTGGIVAETHDVVYEKAPPGAPVPLPQVALRRRPVSRVSFVSGFIAGRKDDDPPVPYVFSLSDYELAPAGGTIRFLPFGKRPADRTALTINYYPRAAEPTVITDVNVGSVARTLLEAVAKELASVYAQLNIAYDSAFVDTAGGGSLDRVVGLLGFERFRAGRAVGTVTFRRRPGLLGAITIAQGTPVTDALDKIRYETSETYVMGEGESVAEVRVRGASEGTPVVEANKLTVIARAVAGLSEVTNERPTARATEDESDDDLRLRVRGALAGADKGTVESLRHGLLQMNQVRDVRITEMPNGVPGEIALSISLIDGNTELPPEVTARIEQLRPAGVRVLPPDVAKPLKLTANLRLLLATPQDVQKIEDAAKEKLVSAIRNKGIGEKIRIKPLAAALLGDARILDVLQLTVGGDPDKDFAPPPGVAVELADVSFGPHEFAEQAAAGTSVMDVSAAMKVTLADGVTAAQAKATLTAKLEAFFTAARAGDTIDADKLLTALREETQYGIDPLTMVV